MAMLATVPPEVVLVGGSQLPFTQVQFEPG
jgi:hypothetical protein